MYGDCEVFDWAPSSLHLIKTALIAHSLVFDLDLER